MAQSMKGLIGRIPIVGDEQVNVSPSEPLSKQSANTFPHATMLRCEALTVRDNDETRGLKRRLQDIVELTCLSTR